MVITGTWRGKPITISVKKNCLTVSLDHPAQAEVFSFDLAGRLWTAFIGGMAYRRGLDGKVLARWRQPGQERERRWLPPEEARQIEAYAHGAIASLYNALTANEARLLTPLPESGHFAFSQALAFDTQRSQQDAQHYHTVYKPVGILPPDQYMAVVLQLTEGCSFNRCNFCTFYKTRPFHIKSPEEFRAHALAVRDFLAEGLSLRRTLFLGDANSLVVPTKMLLPLLDIARDVFDVEKLGGFYAFLDGFSGEKKSVTDYQVLAAKGLRRVYIGLESGNDTLLKFLKKPGTAADAIQAVHSLKAAGVAVGIIILLGAGGQHYAERHVEDTIKTLNAMPLDMDDIIYFSELLVSDDMPYAQAAFEADLQPLSSEACLAQNELIEKGLRFSGEGKPHISRYDIREFIY